MFRRRTRSPTSNSLLMTFLLWRAAIFCFRVVSHKVASSLTSSTNSSSSRRFLALAGKSVLASVHHVSSVSSMGMTASVPYVSRKGDSPVVEWGVVM